MSINKTSYISVDIETAGPNPSTYSILSIGACSIFDPQEKFYLELQPVNENKFPDAMAVSGLNWSQLKEYGVTPQLGMSKFASWLRDVTPKKCTPIFVAFNAPFDWMFINDYFYRYLGDNPFGHKALDIKAFYMGLRGVTWENTGMDQVSSWYLNGKNLSHNALQDALDQAEIFRKMLSEAEK